MEPTPQDARSQRLFAALLKARTDTGQTVIATLAKLVQANAEGGRVTVNPDNFKVEEAEAAQRFAEWLNTPV